MSHRRDVASASAAVLYNDIEAIIRLTPEEQFQRLVHVIEASIHAYEDVPREFRPPEPSNN